MTNKSYIKKKTVCTMCRDSTKKLDENGRCLLCSKRAIDWEKDNVIYHQQLRKSKGLEG